MAKKAKKPRPKREKVKQGYLSPEMEPVTIKEIDQAAENYYDAIQERLPYTKAEAEAQDALNDLMGKHGLNRYEFDRFVVMRTNKPKVSVKKKDEEASEE